MTNENLMQKSRGQGKSWQNMNYAMKSFKVNYEPDFGSLPMPEEYGEFLYAVGISVSKMTEEPHRATQLAKVFLDAGFGEHPEVFENGLFEFVDSSFESAEVGDWVFWEVSNQIICRTDDDEMQVEADYIRSLRAFEVDNDPTPSGAMDFESMYPSTTTTRTTHGGAPMSGTTTDFTHVPTNMDIRMSDGSGND